MGHVWALALAGLFLIYLEFVLPGGIMAIGGGILLLASILLFFMSKPEHHFLVLYVIALGVALFCVVKLCIWKFRHIKKEESSSIPMEELIGKTGVTATDLIPHGQVFIGEELFDAQSKDQHIPRGERVTILRDEEGRLIVEIVQKDS